MKNKIVVEIECNAHLIAGIIEIALHSNWKEKVVVREISDYTEVTNLLERTVKLLQEYRFASPTKVTALGDWADSMIQDYKDLQEDKPAREDDSLLTDKQQEAMEQIEKLMEEFENSVFVYNAINSITGEKGESGFRTEGNYFACIGLLETGKDALKESAKH